MEYSLCNKWFNEINKGNLKKLLHILASILVSLLKQFFFIFDNKKFGNGTYLKHFIDIQENKKNFFKILFSPYIKNHSDYTPPPFHSNFMPFCVKRKEKKRVYEVLFDGSPNRPNL